MVKVEPWCRMKRQQNDACLPTPVSFSPPRSLARSLSPSLPSFGSPSRSLRSALPLALLSLRACIFYPPFSIHRILSSFSLLDGEENGTGSGADPVNDGVNIGGVSPEVR